jgi:hypothetical protein
MTDHKARTIEHLQSQNKDIARRSSVPKRAEGAAPIHDGMFSMTRGTTLGSAPDGAPPDASSPLPTDPSRQGKTFPVPPLHSAMKSDPQRGRYDPALANAVMDEARRSPDDFAKSLHTTLPGTVSEK